MEPDSFYKRTRNCRKILVPDLGFLGDTIHLFPALREIRDAYPKAEIHAMAASHVTDLLRLLPWIDRAWGYPRFPTSPPWYRLLPLIRELRAENFDTVINLNGSSRSSFLTWFSGASSRLGRLPERKNRALWTRLYTDRVAVPYDSTPVYEQRRNCLRLAGIPVGNSARWDVQIPEEIDRGVEDLLAGARNFIHVSPFTTMDAKELAPDILAAVLNCLAEKAGPGGVVISCAPNPRETSKLAALLPALKFKPRHVFAGELSTLQACAVVGRARLHVGGDSGGVHMALMQNVPVLVWFREHHPLSGWVPRGPKDRIVFCRSAAPDFLQADLPSVLSALDESLAE